LYNNIPSLSLPLSLSLSLWSQCYHMYNNNKGPSKLCFKIIKTILFTWILYRYFVILFESRCPLLYNSIKKQMFLVWLCKLVTSVFNITSTIIFRLYLFVILKLNETIKPFYINLLKASYMSALSWFGGGYLFLSLTLM
jgi:hypothetical protein